MAQTETKTVQVSFYREESGRIPVQEWLENLPERHQQKCQSAIERLKENGHLLRHPHVHRLPNGIYELRIRFGTNRYRIFYFWHGGTVAVLTHGVAKKTSAVAPRDLQRALNRKRKFEQNPTVHTQEMD